MFTFRPLVSLSARSWDLWIESLTQANHKWGFSCLHFNIETKDDAVQICSKILNVLYFFIYHYILITYYKTGHNEITWTFLQKWLKWFTVPSRKYLDIVYCKTLSEIQIVLSKKQPKLIFLVIFPKMNIFTRLNLKRILSKKTQKFLNIHWYLIQLLWKDSSKTILYL